MKVAKVEDIVLEKPVDVYCLEVDNDFHSFCLGNGCVVHNCGTIIASRNSNYQGALPIRGKILNVMRLDLSNKKQRERFLNNAEIDDIIKAIGAGVGDSFDIDKSRYGKIIFACFSGGTRVKSLDGNSYSFKELVDNGVKELWVYSKDKNGKTVSALATNIRKTGESEKMAVITLDNGSVIRSTPDHMLMTAEGRYLRADELRAGDSLMTVYTKQDEEGHEELYDDGEGNWVSTCRITAEKLYYDGKPLAKDRNEGNKVKKSAVQAHDRYFNKKGSNQEDIDWLNTSEAGKLSAEREKIARAIKFLTHNNLCIDEYHYNFYKEKGTHSFESITSAFDSVEEAISFASKRDLDISNYKPSRDFILNEEQKKRSLKARIARAILKIENQGAPLTKDSYEETRAFNDPKWESIEKVFGGGIEEAIEYSRNMNHRVLSVEIVEAENGREDVYCMTVDKHHNFAIETGREEVLHKLPGGEKATKNKASGVFVKNCDADYDGCEISVLLLGVMYKLFRPLIEQGRVYQCVSPLYEFHYRSQGKDHFDYAIDDKERIAIEKDLKSKNIKYTMGRAKGLGELNADVFHDIVLDPKNRKLIRITIDDARKADDMINLTIGMGSSDSRKEWMLDHRDVIDDIGIY